MAGLWADFLADYDVFWPVMWLLIAAGVAISIELASTDKVAARMPVFFTSLGGVLLALVSLTWHSGKSGPVMGGGITIDSFGTFMSAVILAGTAIACFSSLGVIGRMKATLGDYLALVLVAASGMVLLATANDLIMVFLAIELMSLAVYVLCGLNQRSGRSAESAMKYFVMGSFASGFLLMGMAILYGITGHVQIAQVAAELAKLPTGLSQLGLLGVALIVVGFAFKVGAVPFHQWVPDVYTGAPTPVTGFMSVAVKAAAFAAFIRMLVIMLPGGIKTAIGADTTTILWIMAAVTMLLGNWLALVQENVKRMLAYSSIAHSGYLLMALVASQGTSNGVAAAMFYLLVYTFGTAGAFTVLTFATGEQEIEETKEIRGLGWKRPFAGAAMTIFMLSLAGIPLTGGFIGKYYLFKETLGAAEADNTYYWLIIIGIAASLLGAFYYLRVIVFMYMKEPAAPDAAPAGDSWGARAAVTLAAAGTLFLGLAPTSFLNEAKDAVTAMQPQGTRGTPAHVDAAPDSPGAVIDAGAAPRS